MFVASYARLPSITVRDTTSVPLHYGSGPLLQCAVPARALYYNARYRLGTARALHYNARYRLGTARALYYNARCRVGTARALHYNARYRLGTARALHYNARYRLGTASVPLGPSITMRGTDAPFGFYKVKWIGVRNFQENTKTNGKPRNATLTL